MIVGLLVEILEEQFLVDSLLVMIDVDYMWYHNRLNTASSQGHGTMGKRGAGTAQVTS